MIESQEQHAKRIFVETWQLIGELIKLCKKETGPNNFCCIECDGSPNQIDAWRNLQTINASAQNDLMVFSGWTVDQVQALVRK
jgi:hypothetical protein